MKYFITLLVYLCLVGTVFCQMEPDGYYLSSERGDLHWKMKAVRETAADGKTISQNTYDDGAWMPCIVPGTVLSNLVRNKKIKEPYWGINNKLNEYGIPDISYTGRDFYRYWYRTSFTVETTYPEERILLQLDGINYIAHIWLNGKKIGNMQGMFNSLVFDITSHIHKNTENVLLIDVEPVEHPGTTEAQVKNEIVEKENRNGGNGEIGKDVTMLMTVGWDFYYADGIRDRNTGIWKDVKIYTTGPVAIRNPFVKTSLPLPSTDKSFQTVLVELVNMTESDQNGILYISIPQNNLTIKKELSVAPGENKEVIFSPGEFPELVFTNPKLWWPVNKGEHFLYDLITHFEIDGKLSDIHKTRFGIREITSNRNSPDSSRVFYVNGKRIFIRGSNWIPEGMCRSNNKRMYAELRYTAQCGINMLRLWGGGISESDYFFDRCDELGILVWKEFWMTGDTKAPVDKDLYFLNVENTVKRLRNHPSLAYYVSSNEQESVLDIKPILEKLDGTRGYQHQSECCGIHDGSPYKYENPMQYYDNTASDRGSRIDGFCPEYGAPALPPVRSLRRMMCEQDLWPINQTIWNYLDGNGFHNMTTKYNHAIYEYGDPQSIEEYALYGQIVGSVSYRSIWENWNYNKFEDGERYASGVLYWYHNSAVPQVCGRMWDWSLEPSAALFYASDALEPLHPQYDFIKNTVSVYNDYNRSFYNHEIEIEIYNLDSKRIFHKNIFIDSIPEDVVINDIYKVNANTIKGHSPVNFIKIILKDENGNPVSDVFYWCSTNEYEGPWTQTGPLYAGFSDLKMLGKASVSSKAILTNSKDGEMKEIEILLENHSSQIAFFTSLILLDEKSNQQVLPVFFSDNYFSLVPGETKKVNVQCFSTDLTGKPIIKIEGYNLQPGEIKIKR